jgi:hypothetical protein
MVIAEMIQTIQPISGNRRIQISDEMAVGYAHSKPAVRPMISRRNSMIDDPFQRFHCDVLRGWPLFRARGQA